VQCWQWHQRNKGDDAIVTMAKMPAHQQWQQCSHDKGNNTSLMTTMMPSQQGQKCSHNNGKDAWTVKVPVHQQGQHHHDKGNDARLTTAKMPVYQ
jgi:hypothetical protein